MLNAPPPAGAESALGVALFTLQVAWMIYIVLSYVWEAARAPRHHRG